MQEEIDQLNELLTLCRNAEKGYQTAAQQVAAPAIKHILEQYSQQRNEFAYKLEQQIRIAGGEPKEHGNVAANAHRFWINLKGMVSGENARAIVEECIRGEEESLKYYADILTETTFPSEIRMWLTRQEGKIREAKEKLEKLIAELSGN